MQLIVGMVIDILLKYIIFLTLSLDMSNDY